MVAQMIQALRIFALCVAPYLWNKFIISYYESIEETAIASFVTFLENAVASSACNIYWNLTYGNKLMESA